MINGRNSLGNDIESNADAFLISRKREDPVGQRRGKKNQPPGLRRDNPAREIVADHGQIVTMKGELDIAGGILFLNRNPHVEHAAQPTFMNMGGNLAAVQQSDVPAVQDVYCWPIPK